MIKKYRAEENGERADVFLAEKTGFTRSRIKILCDGGNLKINGKVCPASRKLKAGDTAELNVPAPESSGIEPENLPLDIVYEDDCIAVINKAQGVTVHAGNGTHGSTLVNALLYHLDNLSGINGTLRPGIVHRIDKNTSGLLVVAKNDDAHLKLSEQLKDKTCSRIYIALLKGTVKEDGGTIDTFIGRDPKNRTKMAVVKSGRRAVTHFKVLKRYENYTLCEFSLETGRTHQIRVHCKYMGHPIAGDKEYGGECAFNLNGQLLHARELKFVHPATGKRVSFTAPLPPYFEKVLKSLETNCRK